MICGDGTGDHDAISTMMMPAAIVVERNRAVMTVMQALTILVDDPDVMVVSMVGPDNHIGLGRRSHDRQPHGKRQGAHDHCFHCNFSIALISPSLDTTAADRFGSGVLPVAAVTAAASRRMGDRFASGGEGAAFADGTCKNERASIHRPRSFQAARLSAPEKSQSPAAGLCGTLGKPNSFILAADASASAEDQPAKAGRPAFLRQRRGLPQARGERS